MRPRAERRRSLCLGGRDRGGPGPRPVSLAAAPDEAWAGVGLTWASVDPRWRVGVPAGAGSMGVRSGPGARASVSANRLP